MNARVYLQDNSRLTQALHEAQEQITCLEGEVSTLRRERDKAVTVCGQQELSMAHLEQKLEAVEKERDDLRQNQQRVNARWDGRVKRLETELATLRAGGSPRCFYLVILRNIEFKMQRCMMGT